MKLVLSGFAGVGKSRILDVVKENYKDVFIFPESAREVNYTKDFFIIKNDIDGEFFQKSVMDNEIMKVIISHINKVDKAIFDRSIIDNLAFASLFYGNDRVQYEKFNNFVAETCDKYETETLYDSILFIHSTDNEDFIKHNILNDDFRKETTSHDVKDFVKKSKIWEEVYFEIFDKNEKIAKNIVSIDHFIDDYKYNSRVNSVLDYYFKNKQQ